MKAVWTSCGSLHEASLSKSLLCCWFQSPWWHQIHAVLCVSASHTSQMVTADYQQYC